jgi:anthranilate phosphoribosyltransferase
MTRANQSNPTQPQILEKLMDRADLTEEEAEDTVKVRASLFALRAARRRSPPSLSLSLVSPRSLPKTNNPKPKKTQTMLTDKFVPEQAAAFVALLRAKGETPSEIAGMAKALLATGVPCRPKSGASSLLDIVGTGGDGIGSVNISTGACVLAAAAGARVAKHGGRSVSSLCGAADVVEALGVEMDLGPEGVAACVDEAGIGFMFAPVYSPAMARVRPVRSALGVRTAFNILGPLLNPARAQRALVGVYDPSASELMAGALARLGVKKALVVHSMGLDELTPMGPADVVEIESVLGDDGKVVGEPVLRRYSLDPLDVGVKRCAVEDLAGGDAALNAEILRRAFSGEKSAVADALVLNAGYALAAAGVAKDPKEGVAMAREAQERGEPARVLERWSEVSRREREREQKAGNGAAKAATAA